MHTPREIIISKDGQGFVHAYGASGTLCRTYPTGLGAMFTVAPRHWLDGSHGKPCPRCRTWIGQLALEPQDLDQQQLLTA